VTSGGVSVIFDGDEEAEFISPDNLVGVSSRPSKKRHRSLVAEGEAQEENHRAKKLTLPRFEMQPMDESQSGRDEDSDDETSQESTDVPSPFRPHPDDEYVKPRRNEFTSYLWEKPDFFRTGLLQSTDRIAFYDGARDDGTLHVYSERFELNKKRFKDGYFRARSDLVLDG
jgi:hypothetical protein